MPAADVIVGHGQYLFMETDLSSRLHLYATTAERLAHGGAARHADAISCWQAASASISAGIICSHTHMLRGSSPPGPGIPGQDELDALIAGKHGKPADTATDQVGEAEEKQRHCLPLQAGNNSAEILALGAEGVLLMKGRNV